MGSVGDVLKLPVHCWFIKEQLDFGERKVYPHQVVLLCYRARPLAECLTLEAATYTSPKQNNCASKEDTILGRPNKGAAGVSGTALPEHSQHSGQPCLESKIT